MRAAVLGCVALCGAVLPNPYDTGCTVKTDCASCLDTQVDGPVALPGLKQNCGWCFKTNECHDSAALTAAKCELYCTAKRLPVFDGPVCPSSSCNPKKYNCDKAQGKCVVASDGAGGTSIELCEVQCALAPPAPAATYQCASGQCTQSPTGIDLDTCQSLCNPQPPAPTPPAPSGTLYQCASGKCAVSPTGIDLATCQALCHPPAPTPPAPSPSSTLYPADNSVCYTDCCDTTCIETNRKFNFPPTTSADHSFKFSTSGTMSKDVTSATFNVSMSFMGTKINIAPASGSACAGETTFKIEGGSLGTMKVDFSNGGKVTCPMKAGSAVGSSGISQANSDPPMGKFLTMVKAFDQDGTLISCQETQVGGCAPAPPAPAPGTQLYGCVDNQCAAAATGVPLQTCQAVCHL